MPASEEIDFVSVEDYLAGELISEVKHEYLGGTVHAMSGGSTGHSAIATNFTTLLGGSLQGKLCRTFSSDLKLRVELTNQTRFYYPDAQVVCGPWDQQSQFIDNPTIIAEVLSPSTRRIDLGEKKDSYLTVTSLKVLLLIEPDFPKVIAYRRSPNGGFEKEVYQSLEDEIPLPEVEATLPLAQLYESAI